MPAHPTASHPLEALQRAVPGSARQVIGLVAAIGLALFLALGVLVWYDLTHPEPVTQSALGDPAGPPR